MASMNDGNVDQEDEVQSEEARALALKNEGNAALAAGHPSQAVSLYSDALALHESAVLYGNRAFAYLKLESYGLAIEDADLALEMDPSYVKALYRRASGNFALSKYKVALKDLKTVCRMVPKDKNARRLYKECDKAAKEAAFATAIVSEETAPFSLDPCSISVDASYDGPHIGEDGVITLEFVRNMVDRFRDQKMIHRKYVVMILNQVGEILAASPNCMDLRIPKAEDDSSHVFTVCGDVHGQFYDLMNIFSINGEPSETRPYLFNGDFVDRGSFSVEVILTLFAYKIVYPLGLFMTRGNHESKSMNKIYGFEGEVKHKLDMDTARLFSVVFCKIPLCAVLEKKVFIVHGGLASTDDVTINDINKLDRCCEPPESGLMCDLLWSDPQPNPGRSPSKRGVGLSFGPDVTSAFLAKNNLELIVRSHEMRDEGYELEHGGQLITIFSAPNYCDQMGNKGALMHFSLDNDLKPAFTKFHAVPHPPVRPMQYANMMCQ